MSDGKPGPTAVDAWQHPTVPNGQLLGAWASQKVQVEAERGGAEKARRGGGSGRRGTASWRLPVLMLVFLDLAATGAVMALLGNRAKDLGATPMQLGMLTSVYGAVQLVSGPLMGTISDSRGRHFLLVLSYVGTGVGYLLMGVSSNLQMLLISRVVTGLSKHGINTIKAYISDQTLRTDRTIELGHMATASGLGIMVGPAIGGLLFRLGGYFLPAAMASILFAFNTAIVITLLPPPVGPTSILSPSSPAPFSPDPTPRSRRPWTSFLAPRTLILAPWSVGRGLLPHTRMLRRPQVLSLFAVRVTLGLAVQLFRQGFTMLLTYTLGLSADHIGWLLSYQGLLSSLGQGFAIRPLVSLYQQDAPLIFHGLLCLGASYLASAASPTLSLLVLSLTPQVLSGSIVRTCYTSLLTSTVSSAEVGQLLGLADSVMSVCRVVGPTVAGLLIARFGTRAPSYCGGMLVFLAALIFDRTGLRKHQVKRTDGHRTANDSETVIIDLKAS